MKNELTKIRYALTQPWFWALIFIAVLPLLSEFLVFLSVIASAVFTIIELRQNHRQLRLGAIGKLLMIFCLYQTLTCILSDNPFHTLFISLMWWFFFGGYVVLANIITDQRKFRILLFMMTLVAGIVGAIAMIQYQINTLTNSNTYGIWRWLDKIIFPFFKDFGIVNEELMYNQRAYSTFNNPNLMAKYLVLAAPFVAAYNFMETRKPYKVLGRICLILTYVGVIFSFSRGGYLALIVMGVALAIIHLRKKPLSILMYGAITLFLIPDSVVQRLSAMGKIGERELIWQHSLTKIVESPIFGYGGGTQFTYELFHGHNIIAAHAHNVVLQLLLEGGIIALLIMGAIGTKIIKDGIVLMISHREDAFWVGFGILAFAVLFLIHGMVDYPFSTPKLVVNFITLLAVIDRGYHLYIRPKKV